MLNESWPSPLVAQATARGSHVALYEGDVALTYAQWARAAALRARTLWRQGVRAGHTVALVGRGGMAMAVNLFALHALGALAAPLADDGDDAALRVRLKAVGADFVSRAGVGEFALAHLVREARPVCVLPARPWPLAAPLLSLCTSGTTGRPKRIELTALQVVSSAFAVASRLGALPSDQWLAALPWHHVGGLMVLYRAVLLGVQVRLAVGAPAETLAHHLDGGEVSLASLVPPQLARVLGHRPRSPFCSRLRAIVVGGGPMPDELLAVCRALAVPLAPSWGMTEAASQLATRFVFAPGRPTDAGPALPHVSIAARGARLWAKGPAVAGALRTSDAGAVDENGHVHVFGRLDDVIVSGGVNVAAQAIEAVVRTHPAVADAAAVASPDSKWGQRAVAFLLPVLAEQAPQASASPPRPSQQALHAYCRARLPPAARPSHFVWVQSLPRDPLGKLRRRQLRAQAAEVAQAGPGT